MKTVGIDIGTTTISGVVLDSTEKESAKILEAKGFKIAAPEALN